MSSIPDVELIDVVVQSPYLIALLVVGIYSILHYRKNPRGAALLGVAILLNLGITGFWYCLPLLPPETWSLGGADSDFIFHCMNFITHGLYGFSWILAAMAVFARSRHEAADFFHDEG